MKSLHDACVSRLHRAKLGMQYLTVIINPDLHGQRFGAQKGFGKDSRHCKPTTSEFGNNAP